jgi:O-glycosyl hydrolase
VVSQFSRFIKSGSVRLASSLNTRPEVLISAYKNGAKTVLVLINRGVYAVKQKIIFQDVSPVSFIPYTTTATVNTDKGSAVQLSGNSITYTLPAVSIMTLVEQ